MPIYVYVCAECEVEVEEMRPISQADDPVACPMCAEPCVRALTTFAFNTGSRREMPAVKTETVKTISHATGCPCCIPRKR